MNPIVSKDEFSKKLEREIRESDDSDPFDYPLYGDLFFSENQILIDDVAAAQADCVLDPNNAQNFKACGLALKRLAYRMPYHSKREQLTQDAKSMLDKALTMDNTDYETMYQLGIVHFSILEFDSTLESYGEVYMKLYHDAIRYFKQVQKKAPHIYQEESWLKDTNRFLPQVMSEPELKEYLSRLESSPSSEIHEAEQMYAFEEKKEFADGLSYHVLKDSPKWTVKSTSFNATAKAPKKMRNEMGESSPYTFDTPPTPIDDEGDDASADTPISEKRPIKRKAAKSAQSTSSHAPSVALLAKMHAEEKEKTAFAKDYFEKKLVLKEQELKFKKEKEDTKILMMNPNDPCITAQQKAWMLKKQAEIFDRLNF